MKVRVIGEGAYLPRKVLSNDELERIVETSDDWIVQRTGIRKRHIAAEGEYASDLAATALRDAFERYAIDPNSIDGIIVATTTPDQVFPTTAAIVQAKLGIKNNGFCFDVMTVCSGFVYAMSVADSMIKSGVARRIAVVGAEVMSRIVDWSDRATCVLFGDGAGVVILEAATEGDAGILGYDLHNDSSSIDILTVEAGVGLGHMNGKIQMNGREVFKNVVWRACESATALLAKHSLSTDEVDWVLLHQANQRILLAIGQKLGIAEEKLISTVAMHANTSAASIPLAYSHSVRTGLVKEGDIILMAAGGAGFAWGSLLLRV